MKHIFVLMAFFMVEAILSAPEIVSDKPWRENFSKSKSKFFNYNSTGTKEKWKSKMGVKSSTEPGSKILSFKINPADAAGPGKGPEIVSKEFTHFGTYSTRLKIPDVRNSQPNVGAVVGFFTYHENPKEGLSEIDFEWLLADPHIIYVGTWTGHSGNLRRIGRIINMSTGEVLETITRINHDGISTPLTGQQDFPKKIKPIADFDAAKNFYSYGFDWSADRIKWWIIDPVSGEKIVLWDYSGTKEGIPQHKSTFRMNFWHTKDWAVAGNPNSLEKPEYPFELEVDWMGYEPSGTK